MLNYGIVGTAFALFYFYTNIFEIFKIYISGIDKERTSLAIVIVFVVLVHGMLDATVFWPQTGLLVLLIIACSGIYEKDHPMMVTSCQTCNKNVNKNLFNSLKPRF